jgi:hypothetical protein
MAFVFLSSSTMDNCGPSPDDDFGHHFKIQEYGEREEDEGKLADEGTRSFPCCFCFSVSAPLNTTNSDGCRSCLLGDCV